jgi:TctA family transporter
MDFDTLYLYDGIPLVIVGLGIFAVPEIVDLLRATAIAGDRPARQRLAPGRARRGGATRGWCCAARASAR